MKPKSKSTETPSEAQNLSPFSSLSNPDSKVWKSSTSVDWQLLYSSF